MAGLSETLLPTNFTKTLGGTRPYISAMRTRLKLNPGQRGTKKLLQQYGRQLVCVRYRYDEEQQRRYKTVELIVDEVEWKPRLRADTVVHLQVAWGEISIGSKIKQAGGQWNRAGQYWELRYDLAVKLGLESRIVGHISIYD